VKWGFLALVVACVLDACTSSYPYLISTNNCNCEQFIYKDDRGRFQLDVSARYTVTDRINSSIEIVFHNLSRDSMSLRQAYIKGTSSNVRYQFNDRFQPLPYVLILPRGKNTVILEGSDTQGMGNPWLKIAGERVVIEIRGLLLGGKIIPPIVLTLVPYNPKISS